MRYFTQLLIVSGLLCSPFAYADFNLFINPLYWRATETLDWVHTNNLDPSNLVIGFQGVRFPFDPGIRVGVGYEGNWDTSLYYTRFTTTGTDSASGNLTTGFLGGRLSQTIPATTFYQTGQADFKIDFNTLDWNIGKHFNVTNNIMLRPITGIEAGVINQTFDTHFQGQTLSISEQVKNNFKGVGPKAGIETEIVVWREHDVLYSIIANIETAYMWGHWNITDIEKTSSGGSVIVDVAPRNYGALGMQGMLGGNVTYKNLSVKLSYDFSDWFNQCQIFDDETGTQNNDLLLQGLTLSLVYHF